jgi:hypothetical protein
MAARPLLPAFLRIINQYRAPVLARHLDGLSTAEQDALCCEILAFDSRSTELGAIALALEALSAHAFIARLRAAERGGRPTITWQGYVMSSLIKGREGVEISDETGYNLPEAPPYSPVPNGCTLMINFPDGRTDDGKAVETCYAVVPGTFPAPASAVARREITLKRYEPKFTSALDAAVHYCAVVKRDMRAVARLVAALPVYINNVLWACNNIDDDAARVAVLALLMEKPMAHVTPFISDGEVSGFNYAMATLSGEDTVRKALKRAGVPDNERRDFVALLKQTRCVVCGALTQHRCCGRVFYCGTVHQKAHRAQHRPVCTRTAAAGSTDAAGASRG